MVNYDFMNEIIPDLWVGDITACRPAREAGFRTICVLEQPCANECTHARILAYDKRHLKHAMLNDEKTLLTKEEYRELIRVESPLLTAAHRLIDKFIRHGPVLVHCAAGIERSPLTVATWLVERGGISLDEAYKLIMKKRPIVEERSFWLDDAERNRYEGRTP